MRKISALIILLVGFLTVPVKADDKAGQETGNTAVTQGENQVLNDEGYGNEDAEYYNSEDDRVNDDGSSLPSENAQ